MRTHWTLILAAALYLIAPAQAGIRADLSGDAVVDFATAMDMPFMTVGNAGNADDTWGYGGVDYEYRIGKFEVTTGQYTEFLNAVAADDIYGVYNVHMGDPFGNYGCNIQRNGGAGSYTYSVATDWADRPVNHVSWGDAARFCNWLHNGRPTGEQDLPTTEDGSYFLNGAWSMAALAAVTREDGARYVIPTEDEWYKAAYHKNDGVTGNYFDYPTSSDSIPSNDLLGPDPGNNANFYDGNPYDGGETIGRPCYRTEAGEFENSDSPYGTFDMGGNVWEWNERLMYGFGSYYRGMRGASFNFDHSIEGLHASWDFGGFWPQAEHGFIGFRVAEVPGPATMSLLALGACLPVFRRKRRWGLAALRRKSKIRRGGRDQRVAWFAG